MASDLNQLMRSLVRECIQRGCRPEKRPVYTPYPVGARRGMNVAFLGTECSTAETYPTGDDAKQAVATIALDIINNRFPLNPNLTPSLSFPSLSSPSLLSPSLPSPSLPPPSLPSPSAPTTIAPSSPPSYSSTSKKSTKASAGTQNNSSGHGGSTIGSGSVNPQKTNQGSKIISGSVDADKVEDGRVTKSFSSKQKSIQETRIKNIASILSGPIKDAHAHKNSSVQVKTEPVEGVTFPEFAPQHSSVISHGVVKGEVHFENPLPIKTEPKERQLAEINVGVPQPDISYENEDEYISDLDEELSANNATSVDTRNSTLQTQIPEAFQLSGFNSNARTSEAGDAISQPETPETFYPAADSGSNFENSTLGTFSPPNIQPLSNAAHQSLDLVPSEIETAETSNVREEDLMDLDEPEQAADKGLRLASENGPCRYFQPTKKQLIQRKLQMTAARRPSSSFNYLSHETASESFALNARNRANSFRFSLARAQARPRPSIRLGPPPVQPTQYFLDQIKFYRGPVSLDDPLAHTDDPFVEVKTYKQVLGQICHSTMGFVVDIVCYVVVVTVLLVVAVVVLVNPKDGVTRIARYTTDRLRAVGREVEFIIETTNWEEMVTDVLVFALISLAAIVVSEHDSMTVLGEDA